MKKETSASAITECLENFEKNLQNYNAIQMLLLNSEEAHKKILNDLNRIIEETIVSSVSLDFLDELKKPVSKRLKNILGLSAETESNLEYLRDVIYHRLARHPIPYGYNSFVAPGENYDQSSEFSNKYSEDFVKLEKAFGMQTMNDKSINIGYAQSFS